MAHYDNVTDQPTGRAGIPDLITQVQADVQDLIKNELALAKAELMPQAKSGGIGAGFFGAAAYFAMNGLSLLFITGALAISMLFDAPTGAVALGFLIMAVLVFVVAAVLALIGLQLVKQVKGPQRTKAQALATVETVKDAMTRATADVKTTELERKAFRHPELR